jgi:predicted RNase H-like HicB family nuclease
MKKDEQYYESLPWEVRLERDLQQNGTVYYIARHPEFGDIAGPVGTGASPEEALTELREARRSLIAVMLKHGDPIPEPRPLRIAAA